MYCRCRTECPPQLARRAASRILASISRRFFSCIHSESGRPRRFGQRHGVLITLDRLFMCGTPPYPVRRNPGDTACCRWLKTPFAGFSHQRIKCRGCKTHDHRICGQICRVTGVENEAGIARFYCFSEGASNSFAHQQIFQLCSHA